jgi:hypothetical protein
MKAVLQKHFNAELEKVKTAIAAQDFEPAWIALQRAHVLGQRDAIAQEHRNAISLEEQCKNL